MTLKKLLIITVLCLSGIGSNAWSAGNWITVGIIKDGPQSRSLIPLDGIKAEVAALMTDEFDVRFPDDKHLEGDWTLAGAQRVFERQLSDPDVDIIICLGVMTCHVAGRHGELTKPVIASIVVDQSLQSFPFVAGASGKKNLVYVTNLHSIDDDMRAFRNAARLSKVAILVDAALLQAFSTVLQAKMQQLAEELELIIVPMPVGDSLLAAVEAIPADVDAVYVTPLLRFDDASIRELADALIKRKLKSFSLFGVTELEDGLLMSSGGRAEDFLRITRRLALNVQRILLGERPEDIPVYLQESRRLAINMTTAIAIGYSPRYAVLADAEQLAVGETAEGESLALLDAMLEAVDANLNLKVASFDPLLADEERRTSRSQLLPQFELGAGWQKINKDRSFGALSPEETTDVDASANQLIYSDTAWAGYQMAEFLRDASNENYRAAVLDTLKLSGQLYLNLLRTLSLENVQRSNLEVTRTNLELARIRASIGFSGRADVLRWETQIARDRRNLIDAEAVRRQAEDLLNQVLNRPLNAKIKPTDASVKSTLAVFGQPRFLALIDNALTWEAFQDFSVERGLEMAPEVASAGHVISAGERQVTAARRRYWIPDIGASATARQNLDRTIVDNGFPLNEIDETSWQIGVRAALPVFSGGALRADLNRSRYELRKARQRSSAIELNVETRIRVSMEQAGSSFSGIELAAAAAAASTENLDIVTDLYSKGAKSVTDLIDAQNAALGSELAAAEAKYLYLGDILEVLRATGDFSLLLDPGYVSDWYLDVEAFLRQRGLMAVQ
jgi:outer membrane protein